jgi:predicted dinucleotide-binding enzyme
MKKISILGTGMVGNTIGTKLIQLGYTVMMGSRTADNDKALAWSRANGENASNGNFEDAARWGEIIFNCTKGEIAMNVVKLAGPENFNGKVLIDLSNPLDFSQGMPPSLYPAWVNTYSLGEEIQALVPEARVVKSLNIVNCEVMVDATRCGHEGATMFMAGNDASAKTEVRNILQQFGWTDIIDLGDITNARGMEMMLPIWVRTWAATGDGHFAFKILRKA